MSMLGHIPTNILVEQPYSPKFAIASKGSCSQAMYARDTSSFLWAWGGDANGGVGWIGDDTDISRSSPVSVKAGKIFIQFQGGGNTATPGSPYCLALDELSYAWAWGNNTNGQMGNNTASVFRSTPNSVVGGRQFKAITAGASISCGLDTDGYAWCWGLNTSGACGDNTVSNRSSPVSVVGGKQFIAINATGTSVIALDLSSYAWGWGLNGNGSIGDNTLANRSSPVSTVGGKQWIALAGAVGSNTAGFTTGALDDLSYAWCWGHNTLGTCGDNTITNRSSPVSVVGGSQWISIVGVGGGATTSGGFMTLNSASYAYAWGNGGNNMLNLGNVQNRSSPISVPSNRQYVSIGSTIRSACGIDGAGIIWSWGANGNGRLGNNAVLADSNQNGAFASSVSTQVIPNRVRVFGK